MEASTGPHLVGHQLGDRGVQPTRTTASPTEESSDGRGSSSTETSRGWGATAERPQSSGWADYTRWAFWYVETEPKSPDRTPTEEDEGELDELVELLEPGFWCASDGKEDGSERAEIDVEVDKDQRGEESAEFIAHEQNDGGAWPRRPTTPPPSPERVYCSGTCDDQCGERIYAGERCGRCWSRRHKHSRGHDWEPGEWEDWILWQRRARNEEVMNFCANVAAHTAAFAAHQAFGFALEAKGSVLSVRNICFEHHRDQVQT